MSISPSGSPLLPSQGDASGINVAQRALSDDFIAGTPKYFPKYMKPSGIGTDRLASINESKGNNTFNAWGVVLAALIFIIILSWFELMRLIIQCFFINSQIVIDQMISYFVYAVVGTIFASLLIFICYNIIKE